MIELIYLLSDFQCNSSSPQAIISANIYRNGALVASNVNKGDKVLLENMNGVTINYSYQYGSCAITPISQILGKNDSIPNLPGAYAQKSLKEQLDELKDYEQLYLFELGTHNTSSSLYDLQDVVFIINNNPNLNNTNTSGSSGTISPD